MSLFWTVTALAPLFVVYRGREAFQAHETAEHVRRFHARKDPLLAGTRVEFLQPGAGTSP